MLARLFQNHVLANLTFLVVLLVGAYSYLELPRQQDPTINFNWVEVTTHWPGASASDIERLVTDPLEEAVENVQDIKFVSSNSREGLSRILVRFEDVGERVFDKRVNDLRREIRAKEQELPVDIVDPRIIEITTANAFPTAMVVVSGYANDENLRRQARIVQKDLNRLDGVDSIIEIGLADPELQVSLIPERLSQYGLSPTDVAQTIRSGFRDIAAGSAEQNGAMWLVRVMGTDADPAYLADMPIQTAQGEITLSDVARVTRSREKATKLVSFRGEPAIMLGVNKKPHENTLAILDRLKAYLGARNEIAQSTGIRLVLADDQTVQTVKAISIMQNNALIGLLLVLLVTWLFLGIRIALLVSIGIPFILAATFWLLAAAGHTLNVMVLLGVVISLGMLVDDAVVVAEAMYYRIQRGVHRLQAATEALQEVFAPITSAVLTTIAAFLPLMLLPGILGEFMSVIPFVVAVALAVSLFEAYWMLPAHVVASRFSLTGKLTHSQQRRVNMTHWIRVKYTLLLVRAMRRPRLTLAAATVLFFMSVAVVATGLIRMDFFASDPLRIFYVNVEMPASTPIEKTLQKTVEVEQIVRQFIVDGEERALVSYAGQMFTEMEPRFGDHYGQILVGLRPRSGDMRDVDEVMDSMRETVTAVDGAKNISFTRMSGGPPVMKPILIKVRGDDYDEIRRGADVLQDILRDIDGVKDIGDDASPGRMEFQLKLDHDAIRRAGLMPDQVANSVRLLVDGEIVATMQADGEKLEVRVRGPHRDLNRIDQILDADLPLDDGSSVPLHTLVTARAVQGLGNIRHYNFRRAITVEADIDKLLTDEVKANNAALAAWADGYAQQFPALDLDTTGALDDIQESMGAMGVLFLFGLGLMYLILGTQFTSYYQPLLILTTIPLAFTGVVLGLLVTANPLSLYTLYGVVALTGIAVNAAIVLISAANTRLQQGMSVLHATLYAARRRVIPILITSLTTIAGLSSLALGLGGKSLIWGPVASAIVWGLAFSSVLTLFVIPVIYRLSMGGSSKHVAWHDTAGPDADDGLNG